jgi:hypothetical protein
MKTLIAISIILFLAHLISCNSQTSTASALTSDTVVQQQAIQVDTVQAVQEPEVVAKAFLEWYRYNRDKLSSFQLVNNANGETFDSTKFYSVNFQATDKYLQAFKESGFVSSLYINNWKDYFVKADNQFKANPQNDGPPENFDYDFVLQSQEIDEDLENISTTKTFSKSIQGDAAILILTLPSEQKLKIKLSRNSQKWLIDNIESVSGR